MRTIGFRGSLGVGLLVVALVVSGGCQSAYYNTMEKFGYHKRDILVDRVEEARDSQEEAKVQFESALEQFSVLIHFDGGELEEVYDKLRGELDRSESKARAVRERIDAVEDVSDALFTEWEAELSDYSNAELRRKSEEKLRVTRRQYRQLIGTMKRAEARIEPALTPFRDQVLFLKHNLNAQAIASLQSEMVAVETDIHSLIKELEASISEANAFINSLES